VEPSNSAAILLSEHNASLRRTQGREDLVQLMNSYATRYHVQHGRRLIDASPAWDDPYLDEVLVRAAWVQFDQGGQPSQRSGTVVNAAARWTNVAALVDRGASQCMMRYIQLFIAQAARCESVQSSTAGATSVCGDASIGSAETSGSEPAVSHDLFGYTEKQPDHGSQRASGEVNLPPARAQTVVRVFG
jgi:hypothetical protein